MDVLIVLHPPLPPLFLHPSWIMIVNLFTAGAVYLDHTNNSDPVFYLRSSTKLKFYFDQEVAVLQINLSSAPQS